MEEARAFFSAARVPAGEVQALLELAALETDLGRLRKGERLVQKVASRVRSRGGAAQPVLLARFLICRIRLLLDRATPDLREVSSLLVEAESCLIGRLREAGRRRGRGRR